MLLQLRMLKYNVGKGCHVHSKTSQYSTMQLALCYHAIQHIGYNSTIVHVRGVCALESSSYYYNPGILWREDYQQHRKHSNILSHSAC